MNLYDAHNHLQEPELAEHLPAIWPELQRIGLRRAVVNGTKESDWERVAALAKEREFVIPSFGLHPWYVKDRSPRWLESLIAMLDAHPGCGVGEIGLDRWIKDHDLAAQSEVFHAQWKLAAERNLAATVHCIQAWGPLWEEVRQAAAPARGFLIHAYGGPFEMAAGFASRGAYFSFSPYFLHERKAAQRETFRKLPLDRILIETDAPALWPPPERNRHPLADGATGETINHPANLEVSFEGLAEVRGMPPAELEGVLEANFRRLFLD